MFLHVPHDSDHSYLSEKETPFPNCESMSAEEVAREFFADVLAVDGINYEAVQQWENAPRGEIECYLRAVHLVEGQDAEMDIFCAKVEPLVQALLDNNTAFQIKERYGA